MFGQISFGTEVFSEESRVWVTETASISSTPRADVLWAGVGSERSPNDGRNSRTER